MHLEHHDVTWVAVSRAPLEKLLAYRSRMGWSFPWVSSLGSDFNFDFKVSSTEERPLLEYNFREVPEEQRADGRGELPGASMFALRDGVVYHTYSAYARGLDAIWGMYQWLDRAPLGRNEAGGLLDAPSRPVRGRGRVIVRARRRRAGRGAAAVRPRERRGARRGGARVGARAAGLDQRETLLAALETLTVS